MLGNLGSVAVSDIGVEQDEVIELPGSAQGHPAILHLNPVAVGHLHVEEIRRHLHYEGIDFDGLDADLGIAMKKRALAAAAAESQHQDPRNVGVPEPRVVEQLSVPEMPLQWIAEGHSRLLGSVEAQDPLSTFIDDKYVMEGRMSFEHHGGLDRHARQSGQDHQYLGEFSHGSRGRCPKPVSRSNRPRPCPLSAALNSGRWSARPSGR
jgi:hypothetical protein